MKAVSNEYGEMVDVLWRRNETAAALQVEAFWNDLACRHEFGLLCGYAMGHRYRGTAADEICGIAAQRGPASLRPSHVKPRRPV